MIFNPHRHYWIVGASTTQVYSSAAAAYVPVTDPAYVAWRAAGFVPTPIATEADLFEVLAEQAPAAMPDTDDTRDRRADRRVRLMDPLVLEILRNHENRLRALASPPQPALDRNEFRLLVKQRAKQLLDILTA